MSIKRFALAATGLLMLAGCTPYINSSTELTENLNHHFYGRPANEFFAQFGQPASDVERSDGSIVYHWDSFYASGQSPVHSAAQYCELSIYTDPDNMIQRFAVVVDSVGRETASRCSEIFDPFNQPLNPPY